MKTSLRGVECVLVLAAAAAPPAEAVDHSWVNAAGGAFELSTNWNPAGAPVAGENALFPLNNTYTVTFAAGPTNLQLNASRGQVTFALGGFTYHLNGLIV